MAKIRDWVDLAGSTIRSLQGRDVASIYSFEWPEAKQSLIAEHEDEIRAERRRLVRWIRIGNALLYGLTRRLTPQRRLLFGIVFIMMFVSLLSLGQKGLTVSNFMGVVFAFLGMLFLLALELLDKLKFRDELELARDLQAKLIPEVLPHHPGYDMHAFNRIANMVGGDLYDFLPLPDGRLAVLFGDASGHGMAAGLVMAVARASFRTQIDVDPSPTTIVGSLNRILCRTGDTRSFFAGIYLLLSGDGAFTAVVAGHPPILRFARDGRLVERIGEGAYPLGISLTARWKEIHGSLEPGETLLLHSDGIVEARSEEGEDFGFDRVEKIGEDAAGVPAYELVKRLVVAWEEFRGATPPQDDVSIAAIRRAS